MALKQVWKPFVTKKQKSPKPAVAVSYEEKHEILSNILRRNELRKSAGLPSYDVEDRFQREVKELLDHRYDELLAPYLRDAYREVEGKPGIAGRIIQHVKASKLAAQRLRADSGIDRPNDVAFDLVRFLRLYQDGMLNAGQSALRAQN